MLRLLDIPLPAVAERQLKIYQANIDKIAKYEDKVTEGKKKFIYYNGLDKNKPNLISGGFVEVTRKEKQPTLPPEQGGDVFLDPRKENPLDFMELDLCETFLFMERGSPESQLYKRAAFTIELLQLGPNPPKLSLGAIWLKPP